LIEIDQLVLEKIFFNINICKYGFPYCGPSRSPRTMMWTILNLHFIRKPSCRYNLLLAQWFWRRRFLNDPHPIFVLISPLKRAWPFVWRILELPLPKDDLYQVWLKFAC
jgi:hypothetical protein